MKNILTATAIATLILGLYAIMLHGVNKNHIHECIRWQKQSEEYTDYYVTAWQQQQCDTVGKPLSASIPVK